MSGYIYNNPKFKGRRRALRKSQTDAERKIWNLVRRKGILGFKFFRQYSVDKFILDFYCPKLKLAIEIDGSQHIDNAYDATRTRKLKERGVYVLRFWNNDVLKNIEGVYEEIVRTVEGITPPNLPLN